VYVIVLCLLIGIAFLPGTARAVTYAVGLSGSVIALLVGITKLADSARQAGQSLLGVSRKNQERAEEAKSNLSEAQAGLDRLRNESAAGLYGFVEERYKTDDYRKYLGMVPLIRRDLQELDRLSREKKDTLGIDRIVLYIDDLDRCPTPQVIKVMEAVNLLFGFPLFVVVIAVDSRWLLRSLAQEYASVFQSPDSDAPTPQDYLEKIIQIPFWIRAMDASGFSRLMDNLSVPPQKPPDSSEPSSSAATRPSSPVPQADMTAPATITTPWARRSCRRERIGGRQRAAGCS
jgi:hypothetical protein